VLKKRSKQTINRTTLLNIERTNNNIKPLIGKNSTFAEKFDAERRKKPVRT